MTPIDTGGIKQVWVSAYAHQREKLNARQHGLPLKQYMDKLIEVDDIALNSGVVPSNMIKNTLTEELE